MNHYPFHIGDYTRATAHLTPLEDCFYRRALDWYYSNEKPIPADLKKACRILRASGKDQVAAVETILDEFFNLAPEGWRHLRCDREIAQYNESAQEREERDANEAERKRRYRERRKAIFEELREYDVVPKWDTSLEHLQSMLADAKSRNKDAPGTRTGHGQVADKDATGTAIQNQNQNQNQINNNNTSSAAGPSGFRQAQPDGRKRFRMFVGWKPAETFLTDRGAYGFRHEVYTPQAVAEFSGYWETQLDEFTQAEWEHKLGKQLIVLSSKPAPEARAARPSRSGNPVPDNTTTDWLTPELVERYG